MRLNNTANILAFLMFAPALPGYGQVKVTPVADVTVLGGKYYLDSDAAAFNARVDAFFSPVLKFGENSELVPVYSGDYSGTQDIQELAGGGVLTRQRQTHTVSAKYVYTDEFDKYKPRVSYSKALIKETNDEKWGKGLFDYDTLSAGFEASQERPHGTFTESYDFYQVKYGNYSTLLSQSQTVIDTTTFNELSANAGKNTLDNANHRLAFTYAWFPAAGDMKAGYDVTYRRYGEQSIIGKPAAGQPFFKSDKRSDLVQNWTYSVSRAFKPLYLSLGARVGWLSSNQNSYDFSRTKFIEDYYSYADISLSPSMTVILKGGAQFGYSLEWRRLYYLGRLKQDSSGNYGSSKVNQTVWLSSLSARYPVYKSFYARAAYNYQVSSSNMRYEANYRYNYRASTYLAGIEWEF